jgi:hypothetical protein
MRLFFKLCSLKLGRGAPLHCTAEMSQFSALLQVQVLISFLRHFTFIHLSSFEERHSDAA